MRLLRIGPLHDQLRSGVPVDGPVELVLNLREEPASGPGGFVIVQRSGINIGDLLIEPALGHPDLPDLLQQVVEIFLGEYAAAVLQAVSVHGPALDRIVLDYGIGPFAELDCTVVVDSKTHSDDHLQVIVFYLAADLAGALSLNYPKISDSCILLQFPIFIYFLDMIVDRPDIYIIEGS